MTSKTLRSKQEGVDRRLSRPETEGSRYVAKSEGFGEFSLLFAHKLCHAFGAYVLTRIHLEPWGWALFLRLKSDKNSSRLKETSMNSDAYIALRTHRGLSDASRPVSVQSTSSLGRVYGKYF